ncbi:MULTISPECIES: CynX/NimT family MFS transporter [Gordonibacter]|uniref:MFS transporter n=1 Tax=Gordonibacter faecis TaxID=3047475 RepID=A0ABT7DNJ0_9ACTN|nr:MULTISPECIES: MFS transporter [unclassified Gordonibacter]MDJ1651105.1 MFS transporter [Gordonibacter sp. KGMB12511]HIW75408.1 MFS transporter [Candidatus Gordonibacter avicola]
MSDLSKNSPDEAKNRQRKGWIVLFAMLFCGIIVIMNQFKVPTFMPALMADFGTDPGTTGWLMSVIAIAGIVTAFPSAFLLNRFGPKRVGLFGLAFMVVGCAVGALSATFGQLIAGRVLEGIGVAMMGVVATTIISMYFPREKAGLPMGIWNLWYVVGSTLAYNIGVPVALALTGDPHNWHAWWWFSDVLALVSFVVFALFVSVPHVGRGVAARRERETGVKQHRPAALPLEGFKVKRMWLFGLGFCFLMFTSLSVLTWVPTYVQGVELERLLASGVDMAAAQAQAGISGGSMASLGFAASIPMALVTAFLLGKFQKLRQRNIMVIIAGFCAFFYVGAFLIPYEYLPWYLVLLGLESGWTSGVVWSMVPVTMPKRVTMPVGMAIIIFFQGISNLLCTPVVGYVIGEAQLWTNVAPLCAVTAAVGTVLWIIYVCTKPPVFEEDEEAVEDAEALAARGEGAPEGAEALAS